MGLKRIELFKMKIDKIFQPFFTTKLIGQRTGH